MHEAVQTAPAYVSHPTALGKTVDVCFLRCAKRVRRKPKRIKMGYVASPTVQCDDGAADGDVSGVREGLAQSFAQSCLQHGRTVNALLDLGDRSVHGVDLCSDASATRFHAVTEMQVTGGEGVEGAVQVGRRKEGQPAEPWHSRTRFEAAGRGGEVCARQAAANHHRLLRLVCARSAVNIHANAPLLVSVGR